MVLSRSKVTSQGQISIPAEIRRRLGIGPGSILEWDDDGARISVRRSGTFSVEDVHRAVFPDGPPKVRSLKELKDGIRQYIRKKHAGR